MSPTKTQNDALPGIDLAGVMVRLDGNLPLLGRLLPQFIEASEMRAAAIKVALRAGNAADIAALLHQMKGSAASVGAAAMAELADAAEHTQKRDGPAALGGYPDAFAAALDEVRRGAEIVAARVAETAAPAAHADAGQIPALLDFLKTNNLRALDVIKDCETFLVEKLGRERAEAVVAAVEGLDFAAACDKLSAGGVR